MLTPTEAKSKLSKFADRPFRQFQESAIDFIMGSQKRFKIVRARTGAGKSLISMVCGVMAGDLTYLVQSKFLQSQIVNDFPNVASVWGRANYQCLSNKDKNCNECLSTKQNPCPQKGSCLYATAKQKALESPYRVLNFNYMISEIEYAGRFSGFPFSVIDEADALESVLSDSITLTFSERSLYRLGLQDGPGRKTATSNSGLSSWREFGETALQRATKVHKDIQSQIDSIGDGDDELKLSKIREAKHFIQIVERCKIFLNNMDKNWIYEEVPRSGSRQAQYIFKPVWLTPELSNRYLWRHSDSWTLVSATFLPIPILAKQLGIDTDEIDFLDVPSTFDPERSPVYMCPVADVTAKNMDIAVPILVKAIKKILKLHPNSRGIIHAVSWQLCQKIMEGVNSPRLITHTSQNRQEVINEFMKEDSIYPIDSCLCSPSSERGLDLRDDLCRWVVVIKCPYPNLGDKLTSSRLYSGEIGRVWYQALSLSVVEQMAGRAMRSSTDSAVTYILDAQVNKLYTQRPSLFSKSFQEQIAGESIDLLK